MEKAPSTGSTTAIQASYAVSLIEGELTFDA